MSGIVDRLRRARMENGARKFSVKLLLSAVIVIFTLYLVFSYGLEPYYQTKAKSIQNNFSARSAFAPQSENDITQKFAAIGNRLTNVSLYLRNDAPQILSLTLYDEHYHILRQCDVNIDGYRTNAWNLIPMDCGGLTVGKTYALRVQAEDGLRSVLMVKDSGLEYFGDCYTGDVTRPGESHPADGSLAVGFQFHYRYLTPGRALECVFRTFFALTLALLLCVSVFSAGNSFAAFQKATDWRTLAYALYGSATFSLLFNPLDMERMKVRSFDRVFGQATIGDLDVALRIHNFYLWFLMFALSFALFFLLCNAWRTRCEIQGERKKVLDFLDQFIVLADVCLALNCVMYFHNGELSAVSFSYATNAILLITALSFAYILFQFDERISAETYMQLMLSAFAVSYPLSILFAKTHWDDGRLLWGVTAALCVALAAFVKIKGGIFRSKYFRVIPLAGALTFVSLPVLSSFFIELIHILNQFQIFAVRIRLWYLLFFACVCLICVAAVTALERRSVNLHWKKWSYPVMIAGISCLSAQVPFQGTYNADWFESANSSILIGDFLNFGKIPIVEHYGGHMMRSVWSGILYGLLNHDAEGAIFSPYASAIGVTMLTLICFYLVKYIWNEDMAFFCAAFFPFVTYDFFFGFLAYFALVGYLRKKTLFRASLFWLALIWIALKQLDVGFSFILSAVAVLFLYGLAYRDKKAAEQTLITLGGWMFAGLFLWCVLCALKGIHPIYRLMEFIFLSLSNRNWAYLSVGNTMLSLFGWSYLFIPFAVAACLTAVIFVKKFRMEVGLERWLLLLILGISYFANFPRALVRHSVVEAQTNILMWTGYLFLALFVSCVKLKREYFLPVFAALTLCNTLLVQKENFNVAPVANSAAVRIGTFTTSWTVDSFEAAAQSISKQGEPLKTNWEQIRDDGAAVERVSWNADLQSRVSEFQYLLDALLDDDETFVDFMNKTFLYSALNRESPVYVSQSPLQLSGAFTQKRFAEQISNVPIALMPIDAENWRAAASLDGLSNAYRNYYVAEYLYQRYRPLCQYQNIYAVWCLKERYDELCARLETLISENSAEVLSQFASAKALGFHNSALEWDERDAQLTIRHTGGDPYVTGLQEFVDVTPYAGGKMSLFLSYQTDTDGTMQLFYTTENGENYSEPKSQRVPLHGSGVAEFTFPVTQFSTIRLDIPEKSVVTLSSFLAGAPQPFRFVDYGYDGPNPNADGAYSYISALHNYNLGHLPRIWAEADTKKAVQNPLREELTPVNGPFAIRLPASAMTPPSNYLLISAECFGNDANAAYQNDDETVDAVLILRKAQAEKCRFAFKVQEGRHDYLIRVSADYYWSLGDVDNASLVCDTPLYNVSMKILEGD